MRARLETAERAYEVEARASDIAASLSILVEHGEKVGLHQGHCPLCEAERTVAEFPEGVAHARKRIDSLAHEITVARDALGIARAAVVSAEASFSQAEAACSADAQALAGLTAREEALVESFEMHGLRLDLIADPEALDRVASTERNWLIDFERALNALEGSQAVSRLASVDSRVSLFRKQVGDVADDLARAQAALAAAKSLEKSVLRSASEIVDERLALISTTLADCLLRVGRQAHCSVGSLWVVA